MPIITRTSELISVPDVLKGRVHCHYVGAEECRGE